MQLKGDTINEQQTGRTPGSPACDQRPRDRVLDKSDKSHIASLTHYLDREGPLTNHEKKLIYENDFLEVQGLEKGT